LVFTSHRYEGGFCHDCIPRCLYGMVPMSVSTILDKMAGGIELTEAERGELRRESENMDRAAKLVNSWVVPGTSIPYIRDLKTSNVRIDSGEIQLGEGTVGDGFSGVRIGFPAFTYNGEEWNIAGIDGDDLQVGIRASDGRLIAGGGSVIVGEGGIAILEGVSQAFLSFYDTTGTTEKFGIKVSGDGLEIQAAQVGGMILQSLLLTESSTPYVRWSEDEEQINRTRLNLGAGSAQGARITLDGDIGVGNDILFDIRTEGLSGGSTFWRVRETTRTPPEGDDDAIHFYVKSNKFIMQFIDAGQVRYKYLDMTGTGVTWVHTTTPP
jgi:hypothetical protein